MLFCKQHHTDEKNVSIDCVIVCATRGYINAANLWRVRVALYDWMQDNEGSEINAFYAEMSSLFISNGHLTPMFDKGSDGNYINNGNSFGDH